VGLRSRSSLRITKVCAEVGGPATSGGAKLTFPWMGRHKTDGRTKQRRAGGRKRRGAGFWLAVR